MAAASPNPCNHCLVDSVWQGKWHDKVDRDRRGSAGRAKQDAVVDDWGELEPHETLKPGKQQALCAQHSLDAVPSLPLLGLFSKGELAVGLAAHANVRKGGCRVVVFFFCLAF